jgi:lysozyme
MIKGVDFSHWQSKVAFDKLVANEIEIAIFKAGEIPTTSKKEYWDDMYSRNISEASKYNIISGAYYYFHPSIGAPEQARHFQKIMDTNGKPDLPPIIDVETNDGGMQPYDCARVLKLVCDLIEQTDGRKPIIYTRNGLWVNQYGNPDWGKDYYFWLAQYNTQLTNQDPKIKENIIMWQYTDKLKLPGIGCALDGNYWLKSEELLHQLAGKDSEMTTIEPEPEPYISEIYKKALVIFKKSRSEGMNSWAWWTK